MRLFLVTALSALLAATAALAAPETELYKAPMPDLPDQIWHQLRAGDVVVWDGRCEDSQDASCLDLVELIVIPRPADEVFEIVTDEAKHPEYLPAMRKARLIDQAGSEDKVLAQLWRWDASVFIVDFQMETIVLSDRNHLVVEWQLNDYTENDLKRSEGHWWFYPIENGQQTLLVYATVTEANFSLPAWLENYVAQEGAREVLLNTRNRVVSGGTWKKGDEPLVMLDPE